MRLVQILGDDIEELYEISDDNITDEMLKAWWKSYHASTFDSFEDWLEAHSLSEGIERTFVDEIYV